MVIILDFAAGEVEVLVEEELFLVLRDLAKRAVPNDSIQSGSRWGQLWLGFRDSGLGFRVLVCSIGRRENPQTQTLRDPKMTLRLALNP